MLRATGCEFRTEPLVICAQRGRWDTTL